jgi:hypothetical protein
MHALYSVRAKPLRFALGWRPVPSDWGHAGLVVPRPWLGTPERKAALNMLAGYVPVAPDDCGQSLRAREAEDHVWVSAFGSIHGMVFTSSWSNAGVLSNRYPPSRLKGVVLR